MSENNEQLPSDGTNCSTSQKIGNITEKFGKVTGMGGAIGTAGIGAINLVGFKTGGILGGSYAAGMMSSAALANGGRVAAGSTVAVLQSLGATGLVFMPYILGAGVVGGCSIYLGKKLQKNNSKL